MWRSIPPPADTASATLHRSGAVWGRVPTTKKNYGHTESGKAITDDMIDGFVAEAESGYDSEQLAIGRRGRGRPPMGAAAKVVESVRLEPSLQSAAAERAADDGITVSEVVRRALRDYLDPA